MARNYECICEFKLLELDNVEYFVTRGRLNRAYLAVVRAAYNSRYRLRNNFGYYLRLIRCAKHKIVSPEGRDRFVTEWNQHNCNEVQFKNILDGNCGQQRNPLAEHRAFIKKISGHRFVGTNVHFFVERRNCLNPELVDLATALEGEYRSHLRNYLLSRRGREVFNWLDAEDSAFSAFQATMANRT